MSTSVGRDSSGAPGPSGNRATSNSALPAAHRSEPKKPATEEKDDGLRRLLAWTLAALLLALVLAGAMVRLVTAWFDPPP